MIQKGLVTAETIYSESLERRTEHNEMRWTSGGESRRKHTAVLSKQHNIHGKSHNIEVTEWGVNREHVHTNGCNIVESCVSKLLFWAPSEASSFRTRPGVLVRSERNKHEIPAPDALGGSHDSVLCRVCVVRSSVGGGSLCYVVLMAQLPCLACLP